ncbi:MAG: TatD family hydrolase [Rhodothermales bacterium]
MLIDTHAHMYLDAFDDDVDEVVDRARAAGVEKIVLPAIDVPSIHRALDLCDRYDGMFAMAALHPSETRDATESDFEAVVDLCREDHVVAVGETGLDYYWDRSFDDRQHAFLRRHIQLALDRDLPIVFHNREAFEDLISIVEEVRSELDDPQHLRGIFHCFTGTPAEAERVADAGFHVGIGGILTFKNAGLDEAVRVIPLEQIVLETDAPYLAPVPHRGNRNEPAYVRFIAERVADLKELDLERVAQVTTRNADALFGI